MFFFQSCIVLLLAHTSTARVFPDGPKPIFVCGSLARLSKWSAKIRFLCTDSASACKNPGVAPPALSAVAMAAADKARGAAPGRLLLLLVGGGADRPIAHAWGSGSGRRGDGPGGATPICLFLLLIVGGSDGWGRGWHRSRAARRMLLAATCPLPATACSRPPPHWRWRRAGHLSRPVRSEKRRGEKERVRSENKRERKSEEVKTLKWMRGKRERGGEKKIQWTRVNIFASGPLKRPTYENRLIFVSDSLRDSPAKIFFCVRATPKKPYVKIKIDFCRRDQLRRICNLRRSLYRFW